MKLFIKKDPKGKITKNGKAFHDEFINEFWKKPGKYYLLLF